MKLLPSLSFAAVCLSAVHVPCQARQIERELHRAPAFVMGAGFFQAATFLDLAYGDVDSDGDIDAVATRLDPWFLVTVVELLRHENGGWQAEVITSVPITGSIWSDVGLELFDFDGDSDLDLLVTADDMVNATDAHFTLLQNNGSGAFGSATTIPLAGANMVQVVHGDIDGDLDPDLIVATTDANAAPRPPELYRNEGAFTLLHVAGTLPAVGLRAPNLSDFEGDGDLDLAGVGLGDAVFTFENQSGVFTGGLLGAAPARHVAGGDFDGDGDGDLLVQRPDGATFVLVRSGLQLTLRSIASGGGAAGSRIALADIDGDGDLDAGVLVDSQLRALRNDGAAHFASEAIAPAAVFGTADADFDGVADFLFPATGGIAAAFGQPGEMVVDPALLRRGYAALGNCGYVADTADFDQDHAVDLLARDYRQVLVRRNHSVGEWSTQVLPVPFLRPRTRAVDIDGDADEDIVVVNNDAAGGIQVFRNDGGFVFTPLPSQPLTQAEIVADGDFNGDGRDDLLITDWSSLRVLFGTATGVLGAPVMVVSGSVDWLDTGVWDFDGDQDLDLLVKVTPGYCTHLYTNDGSGNFSLANPCAVSLTPGASTNMRLVDIDGDGDPDVYSLGYGDGQLLINDNGTFVPGQVLQSVTASSLQFPHFADWDDDGDIDILQLGGPAQLWLNDGHGNMTNEGSTRIGWSEFSSAGPADLDGDGDPDPMGVLGFSLDHRTNHHRSATTLTLPVVGGQMEVRYAFEPGYATGNAVCIPLLSLDRRHTPLQVPGFAGLLQIDLTVSVTMPYFVLPSPLGTATSTFAIPNAAGLAGFDLYAQALILTSKAAWTPAIHERIEW